MTDPTQPGAVVEDIRLRAPVAEHLLRARFLTGPPLWEFETSWTDDWNPRHLNELERKGLIENVGPGRYRLTERGQTVQVRP